MKLRLAVIATAVIVASSAYASSSGSLTARVSGMRSDDGILACLLFRTADGWPGDHTKALDHAEGSIRNGEAACVFKGIPPGDYGIAVLHDEDANHKLKRNFVGMPREGYGVSNDASVGFLSAPPFEKSRFAFDGRGLELSIRVRY